MTSQLILLVDDNHDNRLIIAAILTQQGYGVIEAVNGQQGVELARVHSPGLILMDLAMPIMNGWEATRSLKGDPLTQHVPVIAVTAHDHEPAQLLRAGFCGYIRKPVVLRTLADAVEYCLQLETDATHWFEIPGVSIDRGTVPDRGGSPTVRLPGG